MKWFLKNDSPGDPGGFFNKSFIKEALFFSLWGIKIRVLRIGKGDQTKEMKVGTGKEKK